MERRDALFGGHTKGSLGPVLVLNGQVWDALLDTEWDTEMEHG